MSQDRYQTIRLTGAYGFWTVLDVHTNTIARYEGDRYGSASVWWPSRRAARRYAKVLNRTRHLRPHDEVAA